MPFQADSRTNSSVQTDLNELTLGKGAGQCINDSVLKPVQPKFKGIFMYGLGIKKQGFNLFLQLAIFTNVFPTETK